MARSRRQGGYFVLAILAWAAAPGRAADRAPVKPAWPDVLTTTYKDRCGTDPSGKPPQVDALALPYPQASAVLPGPTLVSAGQTPAAHPDLARIVWQYESKVPLHEEYLKKRRELSASNPAELLAWCEKNRLDTCAEYELRERLTAGGGADYVALKQRWMKYGAKRFVGYMFPLPLEGEWMVIPDATGHHRASHGGAFAYDLMIVRGNKQYQGDSNVLGNWFSFGQPVLAQADGVVLRAEDRFADPPPRTFGKANEANSLMIDYGGGILAFYGHLRQNSLRVKVGEAVRSGQILAEVGNSGHSRLPHLHFTFMDWAGFSVHGRYRVETSRTGTVWQLVEGKDLAEGNYVRNLKRSEK